MKMSRTEEVILRTLAYFDLFSFPLTESEIWKWQYHESEKFSLSEVVEVLKKSEVLGKLLDKREEFYFLKGREGIIEERKKRYAISVKKLKKTKFWIRFLQCAPFVRAIAVCNNLSYYNAKESSDIDLLVITEPGHIWIARFFLAGFLKIFRLRPGDRRNYDGLCPSFFISSSALNMERFALKGGDPYLVYWTGGIMPMGGDKIYFEKFFKNNEWIKSHLPAAEEPVQYPPYFLKSGFLAKFFQKIIESAFLIFPFLEKWLEAFQKKILPANLKTLANQPESGVIISNDILKFHENDRKKHFKELFNERLNGLIKGG